MPALAYDAFRRSLQKGEIQAAYYLHGEEDFLKDAAVRELLERALEPATRDFNLDRRRAGDLAAEEFETLILTPPLLAARRAVVVSEVESLAQRRPRSQSLRAAIVDYLARPDQQTLLILVQSAGAKPDAELSRRATTVRLERLQPHRVLRWIRHHAGELGLDIEESAAAHLRDVVGDELAHLAAELAKLRSAVRGPATLDDVSDLVGVRHGETAHDFTDAVTGRRFATAAGMVRRLLESPSGTGVRLVMSLGMAFTGLALARSLLDGGVSPRQAERRAFEALAAARPPFLRDWRAEAERWVEHASLWSAVELEAALAELLRADRRLKSATLGGETEIVTEAVLAMAGRARTAA